jgi:hypothetical protein
MPVARLAALVAPVYWFSPDEPLNEGREGAELRMPEAFPFQTAPDAPVVYYQVEQLNGRGREGAGVIERDSADPGRSIINLAQAGAIQISFYAYFHSEEGLGAHPHDIEPVEFKMVAAQSTDAGVRAEVACEQNLHPADPDGHEGTRASLVLECLSQTKHLFPTSWWRRASTGWRLTRATTATSPGFDVSSRSTTRGVRDVIRQGSLLSGSTVDGQVVRRGTGSSRRSPRTARSSRAQEAEGQGSYATYGAAFPLDGGAGTRAPDLAVQEGKEQPKVGAVETLEAFNDWKEQETFSDLSIAYRYGGSRLSCVFRSSS